MGILSDAARVGRRYGDPMQLEDVPRTAAERETLDAWLEYWRATVLRKCAGLTGEQLAERSCPPSPMSLQGLVRHLTEMERAYVHRLADPDTPLLYCTEASPDGDFDDVDGERAEEDLAIYRDHCTRSREITTAAKLDDTFGRREPYSLRWVLLYLIKEYARHCGHADLLRERVDGVTGE